MIRIEEDNRTLPLYAGRMAQRYHLAAVSCRRIGQAPPYALCATTLPHRIRSEPRYEVQKEFVCPKCLKRAEQKGWKIVEVTV